MGTVRRNEPLDPTRVQRYCGGKFGADLKAIQSAMPMSETSPGDRTDREASVSTALSSPSRRYRAFCWLLLVSSVLIGGLLACEGWAAWHERLAREAMAIDRLDEAQRHINLALQVRRSRTSTLVLAARIRRLRGDCSAAEQYLLHCGHHDSADGSVWLEWLLLRCQQGDVDESLPYLLDMVRQEHPDAPVILETLAGVYIRESCFPEALVYLDRWLEREPDSVRGLDRRSQVFQQLGFRQEGIVDCECLLQLQPEREDIRFRLARLLLETARPADAAPHLEWLLVGQPDDPDVRTALATCRVAQERGEEARAMLDGVLKDHPEHFEACYQRGKLELPLEHPAQAEPWLRKALQIKPRDALARWSLYRCLQEQPGRDQEAEREFARWEQAVKSAKNDPALPSEPRP